MKNIALVVLCLAMLSGCDKKVSINTIGLMDQASQQSGKLFLSMNAMDGKWEFTGSDEDKANLDSAWKDTKDATASISFGFFKGVEALKAKNRISVEAAKQIGHTKDTVPALGKLFASMARYIQPKTPEDAAALEAWKVENVEGFKALALTVSRLDISVQSDMSSNSANAK